jgi:hypothetical protein
VEWTDNLEVLVAHDNDLTGSRRGDLLCKLTKLRHLSPVTSHKLLSEIGMLSALDEHLHLPLMQATGIAFVDTKTSDGCMLCHASTLYFSLDSSGSNAHDI